MILATGLCHSPTMPHAYEKLLDDVYRYALKNKIEKGTNMVKFCMQFSEDKEYYDEFLFEMNCDMGHVPKFLSGLKEIIRKAKEILADNPTVCDTCDNCDKIQVRLSVMLV